jgi:hypothetical protein
MSGSAALSAARKRRASSSQMGVGGSTNTPSQSTPYYSGSKQSLQGIMNQTQSYPPPNSGISQPPSYIQSKEVAPNVPMNIYENIELIKKQLSERTKLIQTQGATIAPEKLRVLQKQNEIQTQILRQKMMMAQQMDLAEQQKQKDLQEHYQSQKQIMNQSQINPNEPEFIYEKGIPRKNPRYRKPEEIVNMIPIQIQPQQPLQPPHSQTRTHPQSTQRPSKTNTKLAPFISMITDTGVIPPSIVILKSHDATLEEHNVVIQIIAKQVEDLQAALRDKHHQLESIKEDMVNKNDRANTSGQQVEPRTANEDDVPADDQEEAELLMDVVMNDLTNSREFVEGIVDKIVNETNLSEVIMKIEPIVKENQELRSLIHSQQQMMNEMNMMLFRLLNEHEQHKAHLANVENAAARSEQPPIQAEEEVKQDHYEEVVTMNFNDDGLNGDGLFCSELTEIVLSQPHIDENTISIVPNQTDVLNHEEEQPGDHDHDHDHEEEQPGDYDHEEEQPGDHDHEEDQPDDYDHEEEQSGNSDYEEREPVDEDYSEMPHFPEPISLIVSEL